MAASASSILEGGSNQDFLRLDLQIPDIYHGDHDCIFSRGSDPACAICVQPLIPSLSGSPPGFASSSATQPEAHFGNSYVDQSLPDLDNEIFHEVLSKDPFNYSELLQLAASPGFLASTRVQSENAQLTGLQHGQDLKTSDKLSSAYRRHKKSKSQIIALQSWFQENQKPTPAQLSDYARLTGLERSQVRDWFANKRRPGRSQQTSGRVGEQNKHTPSRNASKGIEIPRKKGKSSMTEIARSLPNDPETMLERWRSSPPEEEPANLSAIKTALEAQASGSRSATSSVGDSTSMNPLGPSPPDESPESASVEVNPTPITSSDDPSAEKQVFFGPADSTPQVDHLSDTSWESELPFEPAYQNPRHRSSSVAGSGFSGRSSAAHSAESSKSQRRRYKEIYRHSGNSYKHPSGVDMDDPAVCTIYQELLSFKNDQKKEVLVYPDVSSRSQQRCVAKIAKDLSLYHVTYGDYIVVSKDGAGAGGTAILGVSITENPRRGKGAKEKGAQHKNDGHQSIFDNDPPFTRLANTECYPRSQRALYISLRSYSFYCTFCNLEFTEEDDWRAYETALHQPKEEWTCCCALYTATGGAETCLFCDKIFEDAPSFLNHPCRPYCPDLIPVFNFEIELMEHIRTVHGRHEPLQFELNSLNKPGLLFMDGKEDWTTFHIIGKRAKQGMTGFANNLLLHRRFYKEQVPGWREGVHGFLAEVEHDLFAVQRIFTAFVELFQLLSQNRLQAHKTPPHDQIASFYSIPKLLKTDKLAPHVMTEGAAWQD
ncbi:uncharacterized protein PAC_18861 [Phialocephala subalpina]|uniref:Homeobox domain-containing protein n=1 Tax=Phialocephala subalpina TaxID=576137 RepID=A0A1L7XVF2_9HELO|nr:uncharacterized protein PAC_18861 [Phialocephala subalpina]